jgi:pantetheine-phosphate adenylyltransferase
MRIWVYPGSFDPVTTGHLDIIERAARLCDKLIVAVLDNTLNAKIPAFAAQERISMLKRVVEGLPNVETGRFEGLLADYVKEMNAEAIVRGLRAVSDFEMEFQIAAMNRKLAPGVETVFIMTSTEQSFVSSTMAKDVGRYGGDISSLIPKTIHDFVKKALLSKST